MRATDKARCVVCETNMYGECMYRAEHYVRAMRKSSWQKRNEYFHSDEIGLQHASLTQILQKVRRIILYSVSLKPLINIICACDLNSC